LKRILRSFWRKGGIMNANSLIEKDFKEFLEERGSGNTAPNPVDTLRTMVERQERLVKICQNEV